MYMRVPLLTSRTLVDQQSFHLQQSLIETGFSTPEESYGTHVKSKCTNNKSGQERESVSQLFWFVINISLFKQIGISLFLLIFFCDTCWVTLYVKGYA